MSSLTRVAPVPPSRPQPVEQRGEDRYVCRIEGICRTIDQPPSSADWPVRVLDISRSGVRLLLRRRFEPGRLLTINLAGPLEELAETLLVCVARVTWKSWERQWALGCTWTRPLREDELDAIIRTAG